MAWLQEDPSGNFHVSFRFGGRKFKRSLRTSKAKEAKARLERLEENIRLVEAGRIEIAIDADIPTFLLSDGKLDAKFVVTPSLRLEELFEQFFDNLPEGHLEETTLYGMHVHERHLIRVFGSRFVVQKLTLDHLQDYVGKRSKEPGIRGRTVGASTISKEIVTLQSVWKWAVQRKMLEGDFPRAGLKFPKTKELPPFQTWEEIEAQIRHGNLTEDEQLELWDCLFLSLNQVDQVLAHVKDAAHHPFVYPMFVLAAHTGARRSELIRSQVTDFDGETVVIRERKRVRGKQSTRRVPLSSTCKKVIEEWFEQHPGGSHTFCMSSIFRSKKARNGSQPITRDEASDHFRRTLKGSKWDKIRGWHCFRHSFCSNCALRGIDQRIIDAFVGHMTEAMSRRYRHLFPNSQRNAIQAVFG